MVLTEKHPFLWMAKAQKTFENLKKKFIFTLILA